MKHNRAGYYIKEGIGSIFNHGFMSFASVVVIIACLIIMGSFVLLSLNINVMLDQAGNKNDMIAYVDETLSEDNARALEGAIRAVENVSDVTFVTREDAMTNFTEQYKDSGLFDNMDASILRHRFIVHIDDQQYYEQTQQALRSIPGIAYINAHIELSRSFVRVTRIINIGSIALVIMLLVISLFIMSNTVKLTTFDRREEIAIMKMVGATNTFIRWPFVVEGMMLGLIGSLLAFLIQWGLYNLAAKQLTVLGGLSFVTVIPFITIAIPLLAVFVFVGLMVGVGGSLVAIKNYLKV